MHYVEITKEPDVYIHLLPASSNHLHLPPNITCLDFHPDLSLVAVVCTNISVSSKDPPGMLLHINMSLEFVFSVFIV